MNFLAIIEKLYTRIQVVRKKSRRNQIQLINQIQPADAGLHKLKKETFNKVHGKKKVILIDSKNSYFKSVIIFNLEIS